MANERLPRYLDVLHALVRGRVRYVVVGSFGLELFLRDAFAGEANDCEIVLAATRTNFERAIATLRERAWDVGVGDGGAELPRRGEEIDFDAFAGKGFLRATRENLQLDLTYEPRALGWQRITYAVADIEGVPVAAIETILTMKDKSPSDADRRMAVRVRAQIEKGDLGPKRL